MAALLWWVGGRDTKDWSPWLWWPESSAHQRACVSRHVPCLLIEASCMHM